MATKQTKAKKSLAKKAVKKKSPSKKTSDSVSVENVKGPGGPRITKGGKSGVYTTPADFFSAVTNRFGPIVHDLAALSDNAKAEKFFTPETDAFKHDWSQIQGRCWLNPPFTFLRPWIEKCMVDAKKGADIICLVPAAVGSRWFRRFVFKIADVFFLEGRMSFDGSAGTPYPKDCMVIHFHPKMQGTLETWDWRNSMDTKFMTERRRRKYEKEKKREAEDEE